MHRWSTFSLVLLVLLAGCVSSTDPNDDEVTGFVASWALDALVTGDDHDHALPDHHRNLTTPNFEVLGHDPLVSPFYGKAPGGYLCGDAQATEDGRRLAAVESRSDVGFAIADVTDPAAPKWLGELVMADTYIYDLAVVRDGRHVVLATAHSRDMPGLPGLPTSDDSGTLWWDSPCNDGPIPVPSLVAQEDIVTRPMSLILVDISDPATPTIIDQHPLAGYGHSVFPQVVDGEQWLMVSTAGAPAAEFGSVTSATEFYRLADTAAGARLEPVSVYRQPIDDATSNDAFFSTRAHDGWLEEHPVTGDLVAYTAGGDFFRILDMSDPLQPSELGIWSDVDGKREGYSGQLHSVFPLPETIDGRHYTLLGPEFCSHPGELPTGILWVLDTTNPTDVFAVAAWTLPYDVQWDGCYMFSTHYFTAVGETAFMSLYHGGVWAIDLSSVGSAEFVSLSSVGVFMPVSDVPLDTAIEFRWSPTIEEVHAMPDGTLVVFDGYTGLYTLRFDAADPAPAPEPWTLTMPGT